MLRQRLQQLFDDTLTLHAHLDQAGHLEAVGGLAYIAGLDLDLPDLTRLTDYADIVRERSLRRDLIAGAQQILTAALGTARPLHDLLTELRATADHLLDQAARVHWQDAADVLHRLVITLEDQRPTDLGGVTTGFPAWDRLGPGLLRGGL